MYTYTRARQFLNYLVKTGRLKDYAICTGKEESYKLLHAFKTGRRFPTLDMMVFFEKQGCMPIGWWTMVLEGADEEAFKNEEIKKFEVVIRKCYELHGIVYCPPKHKNQIITYDPNSNLTGHNN